MKKRFWIIGLGLLATLDGLAQKKDFSYDFYGQVRADLFYNSRSNQEMVDGLFHTFPKDRLEDVGGEDLNAVPNGNLYMLYTRLGMNVSAPKIGKVSTSARIEIDFRGSGTSFSTIRLRHAYLNLAWDGSSLLVGQTFHPMFGEVFPQILNLNTGSPYQPFGRAPQIRYRLNAKRFQLTSALVWQSQYQSIGPDNVKSLSYLKNSCVPEIFLGMDYKDNRWLAGAGLELLSLKPRTQAEVSSSSGTVVRKVNERITSLSGEAHIQYKDPLWFAALKTVLASNMTQTCNLGGYGITEINPETGEQKYTPVRFSSTWLNVTYGKIWKPGLFLGYAKNLGTSEPLVSDQVYGLGTNLDQLLTGGLELTYNFRHWKFGVEYQYTAAFYGDIDLSDGRVCHTHSVGNHRVVGVAMFLF